MRIVKFIYFFLFFIFFYQKLFPAIEYKNNKKKSLFAQMTTSKSSHASLNYRSYRLFFLRVNFIF